jgi:hypothetical protein
MRDFATAWAHKSSDVFKAHIIPCIWVSQQDSCSRHFPILKDKYVEGKPVAVPSTSIVSMLFHSVDVCATHMALSGPQSLTWYVKPQYVGRMYSTACCFLSPVVAAVNEVPCLAEAQLHALLLLLQKLLSHCRRQSTLRCMVWPILSTAVQSRALSWLSAVDWNCSS